MTEKPDIATHEEVMGILTEQARAGSVTAAAALAREIRAAERRGEAEIDDTIDRILAKPKSPKMDVQHK